MLFYFRIKRPATKKYPPTFQGLSYKAIKDWVNASSPNPPQTAAVVVQPQPIVLHSFELPDLLSSQNNYKCFEEDENGMISGRPQPLMTQASPMEDDITALFDLNLLPPEEPSIGEETNRPTGSPSASFSSGSKDSGFEGGNPNSTNMLEIPEEGVVCMTLFEDVTEKPVEDIEIKTDPDPEKDIGVVSCILDLKVILY